MNSYRLEQLSEINVENLNQDEDNKIGCNVCGEMVSDFLYNSHMMTSHEEKVDDSFIIINISEEKQNDDEDKLSENDQRECPVCSKRFRVRRSLVRHIKNVHKNKEANQCHVCRKEVEDVKEHYKTLHSYLQYPCLICHRRFRSKLILNRHVEFNHAVENQLICDFCGKNFTSKIAISRHVLIHVENN